MDRIYQMPGGDMLLQDAPETIERFLSGGESDLSTRRNAFLMLYNNAQDRAVAFLMANLEQVANWGDILQNVVLDLIRKVRLPRTPTPPIQPTRPSSRFWRNVQIPKSRGACRARNALVRRERRSLARLASRALFATPLPRDRAPPPIGTRSPRAPPATRSPTTPCCPCLGEAAEGELRTPDVGPPTADAGVVAPLEPAGVPHGPHAEGQVHQDHPHAPQHKQHVRHLRVRQHAGGALFCPTAIKAAANCYCQLLVSQSDNNVKLIVLDRLAELKQNHRYVMQEMVMDILRAVSSPNLDIRRKTLDVVLDLVTVRNIDEVVSTLKKEITKSRDGHHREERRVPPDARRRCISAR